MDTIIAELESSNHISNEHLNDYRASQLNYILLNPNLLKEDLAALFNKIQVDSYSEGYFVGIINQESESAAPG